MSNPAITDLIDITATQFASETLKNLGRYDFPNPAEVDPDGVGLVAMGGDLAPKR